MSINIMTAIKTMRGKLNLDVGDCGTPIGPSLNTLALADQLGIIQIVCISYIFCCKLSIKRFYTVFNPNFTEIK